MSSRIGITGHQTLPATTLPHITSNFRTLLNAAGSGTVVSSLAAGADQLLSAIALGYGFALEVIVPCARYESTFTETELRDYRSLLRSAASVTTLGFGEPCESAFMAAGQAIVDRCDLLVAVWDGLPARGYGGTGDVIDYARGRGRRIRIIWPEGSSRQ